ncbi:general odorant-binding protein 56a-like [Musca vetustissima]|uniref:general odorant-binding protein 56a-like n=1 Tax=Musca vetustissima TaxID=27455 RepID=UPI002AB62177|nr:general odorant-binding protein 56a-like [Musca vetustissima]
MLMVFVELAQVVNSKELQEKAKKIVTECIKESGISGEESKIIMADDLEKIDESKFTDKMKCYMLCFYQQLGIVDSAGKPKVGPLIAFMEERYADKKEKVKPAVTKCGSIKDPNLCVHVFKFERCIAQTVEG